MQANLVATLMMRAPALGKMLALALATALTGCDEATGDGTADRPGASPAPAPVDPPPDPNDPIAVALHGLASEHASGMIAAGEIHRDRLAEGELRDYQSVLEGGHCYRALAVGGQGVRDLDLFLVDAHGLPQLEEAESSPVAILGKEEAFCVAMPGLYRLQVKMWKGGGEFGARFYRSP